MPSRGQALIRKNSVELCDGMKGKEVALHLFAKGFFDENDKESVSVKETTHDQNEKLLDLLLRGNPNVFVHFHQALRDTNTPHLASLLEEELFDSVFAEPLRVGVPSKESLVGRSALCQNLVHIVQEGNQQRLIVLTAPPGFGKSTVLTQVSHMLLEVGVDVIFASLQEALSFAAVATSVLQRLKIPVGSTPVQQIEKFLEQCKCNTLLVLDNAEDLLGEQHKKQFLGFLKNVTCHAPKVHTLVASRKTVEGLSVALDTSRVAQIPLEPLDKEESKQFIMKMLNSSSSLREHEAKQLGQLCGGAPLFMQLATSIIKSSYNAASLIAELKSNPDLVLKTNNPDFKDYYKKLDFFFQRLPAELRDALYCLAVFPVSFSDDDARMLFPEDWSEYDYQSTLGRLESHALLYKDTDNKKYSLHPLIQTFCKASRLAPTSKYSVAMKQFIWKYLEMLREQNTRFISTDCKHAIDQYELNKDNINHALVSAAKDVDMRVYGIHVSTEVVNFLAKVLHVEEFLQIYEGFQDAARTMQLHAQLGACLTSIGFKQLCYHGKELSRRAKDTLTEAVRVWEKAGMPQQEEVAHCLSKLGLCLVRNGETEEGVQKMVQAVLIRKKLVHERGGIAERMLLGGSYCDLGMALFEIKQYRAAINIWINLTLVRYRELLQKHPFTASLLGYIGDAYFKLRQFSRAVDFKRQSLEMRKSLLTEYHPDTARGFYGLGCALAAQGGEKRQEALEMLEKAKHIQVRVHASPLDVKNTQDEIRKLTVINVNTSLQNCHIN